MNTIFGYINFPLQLSEYIYIFDLVGTLVFAISGALAALDKKFDLFGTAILSFVTAVGGGTLRDMLIGETPVGWMKDLNYLLIILVAIILCYFVKKHILKWRKSLFLFDTIGIGLFTILGLEKTLALDLAPVIALLMGMVSAVFGGVIRDVLSNEVPLIFRREIYASACLLGGLLYLLLEYFFPTNPINIFSSILLVILIRYLAVKNAWSLNLKPLD